MIHWTETDARSALAEGWNVVKSYRDENTSIQVASNRKRRPRLMFDDDDEAIMFVKRQAEGGSKTHRRAIKFLIQEGSSDVREFDITDDLF